MPAQFEPTDPLRRVHVPRSSRRRRPAAAACGPGHADRTDPSPPPAPRNDALEVLSHELRGPLASLGNLIRVLERESLSDPARRMLGIGEREYARLCRLIEDIGDLSRVARGKATLRRERIDAGDLIREVAETLEPALRARSQSLSLDLPPVPVGLDADPMRLAQVVENLLTNASKYTDRGGSITVSLRRIGPEARIEVADSGIGIAAVDLDRLFEPYAQLETTRDRADGGLGIGLALVRGLVEAHGGRVGVRSDGPGRGSTFTVVLPGAPGADGDGHDRTGSDGVSGFDGSRDVHRSP